MGAPDGLDQALPTVATGAIPALPWHLERYREIGAPRQALPGWRPRAYTRLTHSRQRAENAAESTAVTTRRNGPSSAASSWR